MADVSHLSNLNEKLLCKVADLHGLRNFFSSVAFSLGPLSLALLAGFAYLQRCDLGLGLVVDVLRFLFRGVAFLNFLSLLAWGFFALYYARLMRSLATRGIPSAD